ncbi:MAG: LysR family transcriptional regulator [Rhizobiales bacterium]|nr:LysR family transcriptional regulator [Hyphomicrobiales bacterium]
MLDALTIDQLRMLVAIADTGSFTAAAKKLQRAQSAVSHAIQTLEGQLGVVLFDRSEKRPRLTDIGRAVLADARLAIARFETLKARARNLASGVEPEISIAVTVLCPMAPLMAALDAFRDIFPRVGLELFVEEIGGPALLVHERVCAIGVSGTPSLRMVPAGELVTIPLGDVEVVAVAAPEHPLARAGYPLSEPDLAEHRQLVPTSRARQHYPNTLVREIWRIADLGLRCSMILRGMGWGTVPLHLVADDLAAGRLVQLDIATRADELMRVGLFAIHRLDSPPGPAGQWLINALQERLLPWRPLSSQPTGAAWSWKKTTSA